MIKKNWLLLALTVVLFLGTLFIYYPGFMSEDSFGQLNQARTGIYTDSNPPMMAFIWGFVDKAIPGQTGMLALQLALYWAGLYWITWAADMSLFSGTFFLGLIGLYPGTLGILGTIWKDILMLGMMILVAASCFQAKKSIKKWPWYLLASFFMFLACSIRHNGIFALPPFFIWMFAGLLPKTISPVRRVSLAVVLAIAASGLCVEGNHLFNRSLKTQEVQLWRLLPLLDLTGIYYRLGYIPEGTQVPFQTPRLTYEAIRSLRTPQDMGDLLQPLCTPGQACEHPPIINLSAYSGEEEQEQLKKLRSLWISEIIKHPIPYLQTRLAIFEETLGMREDTWGPWYFVIIDNNLGIRYQPNSLQKYMSHKIQDATITIFFRLWLIMILNLLAFLWCFHRWQRGHRQNLLALTLGASALTYELPYFFLAGGCAYRYSLWFLVATLIFLFLIVRDNLPSFLRF